MTLHIFAQPAWHDDAFIIGEAADLKKLAEAIQIALETVEAERALVQRQIAIQLYTNDGEGYTLKILRVSKERMKQVLLPYTDEVAEDPRNDSKEYPFAEGAAK